MAEEDSTIPNDAMFVRADENPTNLNSMVATAVLRDKTIDPIASSLFKMLGTIFQKSRLTNSLGVFGRGGRFMSS
jgi:hypothetical protein